MTVHFIGVGPGAEDLLTIRGKKLINKSPICMYAGSLISKKILKFCTKDAVIKNTAYMNLEQILSEFKKAEKKKLDISRLHSGDLSIWSAMGEQIRILEREKISYTVTPGIPSFSAASAVIGKELTLPGISQSLILTRTKGRASPMPESEEIEEMAKTGSTMAIHLSIQNLDYLVKKLMPYYGENCPVSVLYKVSLPEQKIYTGTLNNIENLIPKSIKRTALIIVGKVLESNDFSDSSLYSKNYQRRFKKKTSDE